MSCSAPLSLSDFPLPNFLSPTLTFPVKLPYNLFDLFYTLAFLVTIWSIPIYPLSAPCPYSCLIVCSIFLFPLHLPVGSVLYPCLTAYSLIVNSCCVYMCLWCACLLSSVVLLLAMWHVLSQLSIFPTTNRFEYTQHNSWKATVYVWVGVG